MTYRNNNNNNNRRNNQGGNFNNNNNNNNYGGIISRQNVNPWLSDSPSMGTMGGRGGGGGSSDALALANNLLNNLLRNQNQNNVPPSLLDMGGPRGGYNEGPRGGGGYNDFRVSTPNDSFSWRSYPRDNSNEARLLIETLRSKLEDNFSKLLTVKRKSSPSFVDLFDFTFILLCLTKKRTAKSMILQWSHIKKIILI